MRDTQWHESMLNALPHINTAIAADAKAIRDEDEREKAFDSDDEATDRKVAQTRRQARLGKLRLLREQLEDLL